MQLGEFEINNITTSDFPTLHSWLQNAHLKEWWDKLPTLEAVTEKYGSRLQTPNETFCFVYRNGIPFAFVQYYRAARVGNGWWLNEPDTTVGMDQFIGNPAYLGRGFASNYTKLISNWLLSCSDVKKVIADPKPQNDRAIACYQRAGFVLIGEIITPDGPAVLMEKIAG